MPARSRKKSVVAFSILGRTLDKGASDKRWARWRPTVSLAWQEALPLDTLHLLVDEGDDALFRVVQDDVARVSPRTRVVRHDVAFDDAWDFEEVYDKLLALTQQLRFDVDREDYLVHITTGSHVAQICLFLLTESRFFPARLVQTRPGAKDDDDDDARARGVASVIDLDLSRYDRLASRFADVKQGDVAFLKDGIQTKSARFNALIDELETVAIASRAPVLLTGPTGAGKTRLARRVYALKKRRGQVSGPFVDVNCATLVGEGAMSTLFGHKKGAFTGAERDRAGLLKKADGGVLFLDEVGELGLDEQAMLLRALESGAFLPLGSDEEVKSRFVLLCGTNRDLGEAVARGRFREDLLARIDLWTFRLPGLAERKEDIPPNLDYELERYARDNDARVTLSKEARAAFLDFATSPDASWRGSFRDLGASVTRMATFAAGGRVSVEVVQREVARLTTSWRERERDGDDGSALLAEVLDEEARADLDRFDAVQLAEVVRVCRGSRSLSEAGRALFAASRRKRASTNDADRLRKYLRRFGLDFETVRAPRS